MKKTIIAALAVVLGGCSMLQPSQQLFTAHCTPEDSRLIVNGQSYPGKISAMVQRNKTLDLTCSRDGYYASDRTVSYGLSGTGKLDAVGTFILLVPAVGLLTGGAYNLDQTSIEIEMAPKPAHSR